MFIDALGKACPQPVILAKKALDAGAAELTVAVDNSTAVQNLTRLAASQGLQITVEEKENSFELHFFRGAAGAANPAVLPPETAPVAGSGCAVFIGKDHVGEGDPELGYSLMKMALYTLAQGKNPPASLLFMNSGVKLPAGREQQVLDSLDQLIAQGAEVLVCGACLNFYGLADQLKAGRISNMYEILETMQGAEKVISL